MQAFLTTLLLICHDGIVRLATHFCWCGWLQGSAWKLGAAVSQEASNCVKLTIGGPKPFAA